MTHPKEISFKEIINLAINANGVHIEIHRDGSVLVDTPKPDTVKIHGPAATPIATGKKSPRSAPEEPHAHRAPKGGFGWRPR